MLSLSVQVNEFVALLGAVPNTTITPPGSVRNKTRFARIDIPLPSQ